MNPSLQEQDVYLAAFSRLEQRLNGSKNSWLHAIRKEALALFCKIGFPTMRDEQWRFTNVAPIVKTPFQLANPEPSRLTISDISRFTVCEARCTQMVFLNGFYSESLSTVKYLPKGVQITSLAAAIKHSRDVVEPLIARSALNSADAFSALNTALLADGAFVYVPSNTVLKDPVHLLFLSTGQTEPAISVPRTIIFVGDNSQANIVESYAGLDRSLYFTNAVTEIFTGTNAHVDHYKLQRENDEAFHIANAHISQGRDSSYTSHSLSLGGALVRSNITVLLDGTGSSCVLNGLYVAKGQQHVDNHTTIDHAKSHCSSQELYKGILDDSSSAVFNGRIVVRKDAQKTNARQTNKNLLLSKNASINSAPQLEILADDVKCNHGATIGQLNEEELFYLRSRGIDSNAAKTLLTYAFASELLAAVKIKPIQCQIDLVLLNRLSRAL